MAAVDLNLLRVFDVLLEEQNVTRAGQRLSLSQSAVSHALTRLRHHFGDPLFVRGPAGMLPTARALEIGPAVHAALSQLQTALLPSRFDPAQTERRFTISTGAYGCAILVPALVAHLAVQAPKVDLVIVQPRGDVIEQLDTRRADFAFWANETPPERVMSTVLLEESLVWAVRPQHPILQQPVTLESLASIPHVVVTPPRAAAAERGSMAEATWVGLRPFEDALAAAGLRQRAGVTVPDIYSAVGVASRSDMATLIPRRLAVMSETLGMLRHIKPPHPTPTLQISLMLLKERLDEPALAWMRDLLLQVATEV